MEITFVHQFLSSNFKYYQKLSVKERERFAARVIKFIKYKEFESRSTQEITDEMKLIISATAIQLTFGLDRFLLEHFDRIFVYPNEFYSPMTKTRNVGEINLSGIIVFSWSAIQTGFESEDGRNVALHELAHALNFTDLMGKDSDEDFSAYFDKWYVISKKLLENKESDAHDFLRDYAFRNLKEFFAVGVEYFFEKPKEFKEALPELYLQFSNLLNQDPLQADNILRFDNEKKINELGTKHFDIKSKSSFIVFTSIAIICFLGIMIAMKAPIIIISIVGIIGFWKVLTKLAQETNFEVYENGLAAKVKGVFGKELHFIPYENMISANYEEVDSIFSGNQPKLYLTFTVYRKGKIISPSFRVYSGFEAFLNLYKFLYNQKDVAIKENGRIFIPKDKPV